MIPKICEHKQPPFRCTIKLYSRDVEECISQNGTGVFESSNKRMVDNKTQISKWIEANFYFASIADENAFRGLVSILEIELTEPALRAGEIDLL